LQEVKDYADVQEVWHQKVDEQQKKFREIQESLGNDFLRKILADFFWGSLSKPNKNWGLDPKKGKHHKDL
jgi:hypothetical protein